MYEELVKSLRICTSDKRGSGCGSECSYGKKHPLNYWCMDYLLTEAADAIEELQADKAALNGTVTNLLEQIKELGKPRWIPVTERLPEPYVEVLLYSGEDRYTGYMHNDKRFTVNASHYPNRPTHWAHLLPAPPKEET